jgi:hypothetical protein
MARRTPAQREAERLAQEEARKEWARYWAQQLPPSEEQKRRIAEIVRGDAPSPTVPPIKRIEELLEIVREEAREER